MVEEFYFYKAKTGDEVCVVDTMLCNFKLDVVMDIIIPAGNPNEKYLHLRKSKMIVSERDKYLLYSKEDANKLFDILQKLFYSTEKNWFERIPILLKREDNSPLIPPVPQGTFDVKNR